MQQGKNVFTMRGFAKAVILLLGIITSLDFTSSSWVWECDSQSGFCTKHSSEVKIDNAYPSVEVCRLVCGSYGPLWPRPQEVTIINSELIYFASKSIQFETTVPTSAQKFMDQNIEIIQKILSKNSTETCEEGNVIKVSITVSAGSLVLNWDTNEGYELKTLKSESGLTVFIEAQTVFGARHGLETLTQLVEIYKRRNDVCLVTPSQVTIKDAPIYPHRGVLLDCARNFQSVTVLKRHIDAMAASKLNVLHWHVTDTQSFPLELPNLPNMTKFGAYSEQQIYHREDVQELFSYAKIRGVRIVIEIDAPSHAGNGWQWGPEAGLGNLSVCINQAPWRQYCIQPPCGQLNPINDNVFAVLETLYEDVSNYQAQGEIFHMGGDEVFINCWNTTQEIIDYFGTKPRTMEAFLELWSDYQRRALEAFDKAVGNQETSIILWTSHITQAEIIDKYLSKERYVIQTWVPASDTLPHDLLKLGYRVIVSTKDAWYLDHGVWGTTVYHSWRDVYNNQIPTNKAALGGEVCMWGEYVDSNAVESRTWPRASAAAERLWSNPSSRSGEATVRFYRHRERLVHRGVKAEAVIPLWCYQNENECV